MRIDNIILRRIKDSANIVEVIGDFRELHHKGSDYLGLCPFHNDRHLGSFVVSERRNTYTCFACGAHGDSIEFLMRHENMTFFEAVAWLGKKYGISVEGTDRYKPTPARPRFQPHLLPTLALPLSMVTARLDTHDDALCNWIRSLSWNDEQRERIGRVLRSYGVGHARQGHTIFWQIDEKGSIRTGKFMLYKADGHRDKETPHNFTWAHSLLSRAGKVNLDTCDMRTTFFGMHLLAFHPGAAVNIVESEKTALLASIMWGHPEKWIWLASGGLSMLSEQRLRPIIEAGRDIFLYPDRDGITAWKQQAMVAGYKRMHVCDKYVTDYWRSEDGPKADLGDIIVGSLTSQRHLTEQTPPAVKRREVAAEAFEKLAARNPCVKTLADKLKFIPVEAYSYGTED